MACRLSTVYCRLPLSAVEGPPECRRDMGTGAGSEGPGRGERPETASPPSDCCCRCSARGAGDVAASPVALEVRERLLVLKLASDKMSTCTKTRS